MIRPGSLVKFVRMPEWVESLPKESREVFIHCLGKPFPVIEFDESGLCVLDVSAEVDAKFGGLMNDLRIEMKELVEVMDPFRQS